MTGTGAIRKAYTRYGAPYTLGRSVEYALLQTRPSAALYWKIAPRLFRWRHSRDLAEYTYSPDPFAYRYVDPRSVERFSGRATISKGGHLKIGQVIGGDWDEKPRKRIGESVDNLFVAPRVDQTLLYEALVSHFVDGVPWEETEFFELVASFAEAGEPVWHECRSLDDVRGRCDKLDKLYANMRENGYLTQDEFRRVGPSADDSFGFRGERLAEVLVDISRDGEFLLLDGRHRLVLSRILGFDEIPVCVVVRHEDWMSRRETLCRREDPPAHPDLVEAR